MNTHRFDDLKNDAYQKLNETQSILDNMSDRAKVERDVVLDLFSDILTRKVDETLNGKQPVEENKFQENSLQAIQRELAELRKENDKLKAQNEALQAEIKSLKQPEVNVKDIIKQVQAAFTNNEEQDTGNDEPQGEGKNGTEVELGDAEDIKNNFSEPVEGETSDEPAVDVDKAVEEVTNGYESNARNEIKKPSKEHENALKKNKRTKNSEFALKGNEEEQEQEEQPETDEVELGDAENIKESFNESNDGEANDDSKEVANEPDEEEDELAEAEVPDPLNTQKVNDSETDPFAVDEYDNDSDEDDLLFD